jgi:hypothetical protein
MECLSHHSLVLLVALFSLLTPFSLLMDFSLLFPSLSMLLVGDNGSNSSASFAVVAFHVIIAIVYLY